MKNLYKHHSLTSFPTKQIGGATLLMSLILVIIMGLISVYSSQTTVTEQRISSNHYRMKQAFEAAQGGLDAVISKLDVNFVASSIQNSALGNNESFHHAGLELPPLSGQGHQSQSVGSYSVEFKINDQNPDMVDVTVFGFAGDNQTNLPNQTIFQRLKTTPMISYKPPTPLIARNSISIGGDVSVSNKTNSDAGTLPKAIWSGGSITTSLGGTTASIDVVSNDGTLNGGTGTYENNQALRDLSSDGFFQNFFSEDKQKLKARATVIDCSNSCTGNDLLNSDNQAIAQIIWVETSNNTSSPGKLTINEALYLGSTERPVLLIVDGELTINNVGANLNGIIYTTRDFLNSQGSGYIKGSLISEQNINASGNLHVTYNDGQLSTLKKNTSYYTRVAGSWRDF